MQIWSSHIVLFKIVFAIDSLKGFDDNRTELKINGLALRNWILFGVFQPISCGFKNLKAGANVIHEEADTVGLD